jgi:hypothetical protein
MGYIPTREQFLESRRREELQSACHTNNERGFIVRVELHQVENSRDYKDLHKYMLAEGFQGVVTNDKGVRFKLPTATYYHPYPDYMQFSSAIYDKALVAVQTALKNEYRHVKAANQTPTIMVTGTDDLYWTGLELADDE